MCTGQAQDKQPEQTPYQFAPSPAVNWPDQKRVDMGINNHESYLDPTHKFVNPDYAKEQNTLYTELPQYRIVNEYNRKRDAAVIKKDNPPSRIDPETSKRLMAHYIAVQDNPVAKLGFDPSRHLDTKRKGAVPLTVGGVYQPRADLVMDFGTGKQVVVHESIHRGIQKLIESKKLSEDTIIFLNQRSAKVGKEYSGMSNNELATRMLMLKYHGPIEAVDGDLNKKAIGNLQIRQAAEYSKFMKHNASKRMRKALTEIQNAAKKENDALLPPGGAF